MTQPIVRKLKHPIEIRAKETGEIVETITELTFTRPKGKHLKAMDRAEGETGKTLALLAAITGHPPSVMDQLDGEDLASFEELIEGFFGGRRPTGATSSGT